MQSFVGQVSLAGDGCCSSGGGAEKKLGAANMSASRSANSFLSMASEVVNTTPERMHDSTAIGGVTLKVRAVGLSVGQLVVIAPFRC